MQFRPTRRQLLGGVFAGGLMWGAFGNIVGMPFSGMPLLPRRRRHCRTKPLPSRRRRFLSPRLPGGSSEFVSGCGRIKSDCLLVSSVLNHAVRYLGFFDPELQGRGSGSPQLVSVLLPIEGDPVRLPANFYRCGIHAASRRGLELYKGYKAGRRRQPASASASGGPNTCMEAGWRAARLGRRRN